MKNARRSISLRGGFLLAGAIAAQAAILAWLCVARRIPNGHDGFQYLTLQYDFLNSAATAGQIPQWMPYMTQGTIATWWYDIQAASLDAALLPLGRSMHAVPFLVLFYLGIFIDFVFLMLGTWLLAARFLQSKAAVFLVTMTAALSTLWYNQVWHNFHFFSAIPLVLYLLHRFLDDGEAKYLFLAGSLFLLQMFGNLPYASPAESFMIACYMAVYIAFNRQALRPILERSIRDWRLYAALLVLAAMAVSAFVLLSYGTKEIAFRPEIGRNAHGTVGFNDFISYAGKLGPIFWTEPLLGIAPGLDYSLYIGYLALPLIGLSFLAVNRRNAQFFVMPVIAVLLSEGVRPMAFFFFVFWPLAEYYRHLALIAPFARLFLCFLLGFGAEELFKLLPSNSSRPARALRVLAGGSIFLLVIGGFLAWVHLNGGADWLMSLYHTSGGIPLVGFRDFAIDLPAAPSALTSPSLFASGILRSAVMSAAAGLFLLAVCFSRKLRSRSVWIAIACFLQLADLGSFHVLEALHRTVALSSGAANVLNFEPMPYAPRRLGYLFADPPARFDVFLREFPFMGSNDWTHYMFFFVDSASGEFRTDNWLESLDRLVSAVGFTEPSFGRIRPGNPWFHLPFVFPTNDPGMAKLVGLIEDKVQFFSEAHRAADEKEAESFMAGKRDRGDVLLVEAPAPLPAEEAQSHPHPDKAARVELNYRLMRFDDNHLAVEVDNRENRAHWLFYSDAWHPGWRAKVNGQPEPIYRADLAYKALPLPAGIDRVEITFGSSLVFALQLGLAALAWFWLALAGYWLWRAVSDFGRV